MKNFPRAPLAAALLVVIVGIPNIARADARAEAKRHYRDGMALIAASQIERGIEELKAAYAIKPHPDVLYNIARAYVDLGDISDALRYFRLYVNTDPEDKQAVEAVMQRLFAVVAPAPSKEAAAAPAQPAPLATTIPTQNVDVQQLLAQLQAMINANKQAQSSAPTPAPEIAPAPAPAPEDEMFAPGEITAQSKATAQQIAQTGLGAEHPAEDLFEEQVVTAGVRATAETKAPASLTVITEDEIKAMGAVTIPDILRGVPGVDVATMNGSDVNISIRGFNRRVANKVLVLVDGRSVYQDFLGDTLWSIIDVAIPDIARIEVIRGPGSALYGANAFAGVVNIITKSATDTQGPRAWAQAGEHNTVLAGASVSGKSNKLTYRMTAEYDRADKWSRDEATGEVALVPQFPQVNRSREVEHGDATTTYDLGKSQISASGGYDNFGIEIFPVSALRTFDAIGNSGFARLDFVNGETKLRLFWNGVRMNAGPEYFPAGLPSLATDIRSDVVDFSAQSGVAFKFYGQHHFNYGVGYRLKSVDWNYLGAQADGSHRYTENHFNLFLQEEWQINKPWSLVLSYRVDRNPVFADNNVTPGGLIHSPRGTVLYEFLPDQVLRFTVGTAFRSPTFLENYIDLLSPVPNEPGLGIVFQGSTKLKPEQIVQAELGYRGHIGERFSPEVVAYAERVTDLIDDNRLAAPGVGNSIDPATGQYILGYTGYQNLSDPFLGVGLEIGGKWQPTDNVDLSLNYSFEKMADCADRVRDGATISGCDWNPNGNSVGASVIGSTAENKLNFSAIWRTRVGLDLSTDIHFVSSVNWVEAAFDPSAPGGNVFNSFPLDAYTLINGKVSYHLIKDKLEVGVAVFNLLDDGHREHPFGNQLSRRVTGLVTGSF